MLITIFNSSQPRRRKLKPFSSRPLDSSNSLLFRRQSHPPLLFHWSPNLNKRTMRRREHVRTRVMTPCRRHSPSPYRTGGPSRSANTSSIWATISRTPSETTSISTTASPKPHRQWAPSNIFGRTTWSTSIANT